MKSEFVKKTDPLEKAIEIIIRSVDPEKIILFGSRARGDHKKESDYDICVIKKGVFHRRKVAQQIYRFLYGMGAPVDIIVETPEKFEELKDNPFMIYKEISKSGKVVYEK
jgi:predicted nucleotidyltransferase